ncbi:MAG: polysaccharide biosynthesis/export family protein [Planctomycetes bacterium]|nr:polysaccharide biosynthesis/export family protein [Planctomycetota bacterium]
MLKSGIAIIFLMIASMVIGHAQQSFRGVSLREDNDLLEVKARELDRAANVTRGVEDERTRGRRRTRRERQKEPSNPIEMKDGAFFNVGKVSNYKVLRDDQVVELRNPRTGRLVITVVKASALAAEDLERFDLEYSLMELDKISIQVEKHDEEPREVRVGWDGTIHYPLIGDVKARGLTISQLEKEMSLKFEDFVKKPVVHAEIVEKSPKARILVVGRGFREFQGHEKILDILGADYEPSVENIYDKVCVIRKRPDNSHMCIVVDMEYMFKRFDFRQNIPLQAGDIVQVKKMPPLFGYRFKYWWQQVLEWMNEIDEMFNAVKSVHDFDLKD